MTFRPLNPFSQSGTARRATAALLLSAALALTCAAPSHAWAGFGHSTLHAPARALPEGGFFHFLLKLFGLADGTMDTNCPRETNGTMDPNGNR